MIKLYMVKTHNGKRLYARARNGFDAILLVNRHLKYFRKKDYAINAYNWDDQLVVPG